MTYGNIKHRSFGLNWYFTARDTMYGNQPEGHIIIAQQNKKNGHSFSHTTPEKLAELIKTNKGLYEVLTDYPKKMYADIDFHDPASDFNQEEYLENCIRQFREFLPNIEFAISGSVSESKASFHFVSTNYIIENEEQLDFAKQIAKAIFLENEGIDWKVYTKNREMKCINQSKPNKSVQSPITHKDEPHKHLISCFIEPNCFHIPTLLDIKNEDPAIKLRKVKNVFVDDIPTKDLPNPEGITWEELGKPENAETLLALIPYGNDFPHYHTYTVCNFCVNNNVPKASFLKWLEQKGDTANDIANRKQKYSSYHWNKLVEEKQKHIMNKTINQFAVSQFNMRQRLLRWYPDLKPEEVIFNKFKEQMSPKMDIVDNLSKDTFEVVKSRFHSKFLSLNHPMGFGKTTHLIDYLKWNDMNGTFLYVVPRITLAEDIYTRMTQSGIDVKLYKNIGRNKEEKAELLSNSARTPNVIICLNSLHYLLNRDKLFDYVIFDEIETSLSVFVGSGIDKFGKQFMTPQNKQQNLLSLQSVIKNARQVIALDAFITTRWVNFTESICPKDKHTILTASNPDNKVRKVIQIKGRNFQNTLKMIAENIIKGEKVFCFYPYKTGSATMPSMDAVMETIAYIVKDKTNNDFIRGEDYQCYNGDSDDIIKKEIGNVNEFWNNYKLVMCNNTITAGVSYIAENKFSKVYLFIAPFNLPRDITQVSMRCRQLTTDTIYTQFIGGSSQEAIADDTKDVNMSFYSKLYEDSINELLAPQRKSCDLFFMKAHFDVSQSAIVNQADKEVKDILEEIELNLSQLEYDAIQDLNDSDANDLMKEHLTSLNAKTSERYALRKFMFKKNFEENTPESIIREVWDNGMFKAIKLAHDAKTNEKSFENLLAKANNWDFFPEIEGEKLPKDCKINFPDEARNVLFDEWSSRFTKQTTQIPALLTSVYNSKYGREIISTKNIGKARYYYTDYDEMMSSIISNATPYLKKTEETIIQEN